jgi:arsenate reductase (thioredoxin)
MLPELQKYWDSLPEKISTIPEKRRKLLEQIADKISHELNDKQTLHVMYVCTHNSRRSQFAQVWGHVAVHHFGLKNIQVHSGGTEATAIHSNAVQALKRSGFQFYLEGPNENARHFFTFDKKVNPVACYSKIYNAPENPKERIFAIMTCGEAEKNCPFIPGVLTRFATTYEDPKAFDGTESQDKKYDERCRQIALETFYLFSKVNA